MENKQIKYTPVAKKNKPQEEHFRKLTLLGLRDEKEGVS